MGYPAAPLYPTVGNIERSNKRYPAFGVISYLIMFKFTVFSTVPVLSGIA